MKNFTKKIFVFLAMTGLCFSAYGAVVNQNAAQAAGANFLISKGVQGVSKTTDLTLSYTASSVVNGSTIVDYYVFNATGTKAFVMVSGDDNIIPILAFSNTSSFDINNISPETKNWIEGYKNQITAAITNNVPARASSAALWNELKNPSSSKHHLVTATTAVTPLVQTTWDQDGGGGTPYNAYCPNTSTTGGLSVTGCVSTAMAQVMKFWNWPTVGCGYHTYYDTYNSSESMGSNSWNTVDYANTAFNWTSMSTSLSSSNAAVATLMYATGVSVNMSYSADESGSFVDFLETSGVNCAEYALQTYFHYKPTLHSVLRFGIDDGGLGTYYEGQDDEYYHGSINVDSVNEATWVSMLQTELSAGHPMLYEGQGTVGGHCWVLDGWETTDDMFHFNWGWSGASNGYYTVDNLAPPALGTGGGAGNFNYDQGVIMGIVPDSFPANTPGTIEMQAHLNTANSTPMDYGTPFSIITKIKNTGTSSFSGSFCVQLFDTANNFITNLDTITGVTITAGDSSAALTFSCNSYAVTPLIYNGISIAYQATGTSTWTTVANNGSFINYGIVGALNDTNVALFDSLHVGNHIIQQGNPLTVTTTIGNNGYGTVHAAVEAILVNTATGATFTIQTHASASMSSSGASYTFTNPAITVAAGLYALEIEHQYNGTGSYYTTSSDYYLNPVLLSVVCTPNVGTITGIPAVCLGSDVTLADTALSGSGTWTSTNGTIATVTSGVVSGLTAGIDTVLYSLSNTCGTASAMAIVSVDVFPTVTAIMGADSACVSGGSTTLSDATTGGAWAMSNGSASINGSGSVSGLTLGVDTALYIVSNACGADTSALTMVVIDCTTGANSVTKQSDVITLYPNPTQNSISISSTGMITNVAISNLFGQRMFTGKYNTNELEISLEQYPAGVYMVRVNDTKVYKVIKQ